MAYRIALLSHHKGRRAEQARAALADALADADVGEPDEQGVLEVELQADSQEDALQRVWDAVAASGADDHLVFMEHPDLPEHWRHRAGTPAGS